MTKTVGNLRGNRKKPDIRNIKKRSDYSGKRSNNMLVGGEREKTDTGYIIKGFQGKSFETYFEYMLPHSGSNTVKHEKKDKTVRVISGILYAIIEVDGKLTQIKAIAGDEIAFPRDKEYRLVTTAEPAQFFACQNAKYDQTLKIIENNAASTSKVTDDLLVTPTMYDRLASSRPQDLPRERRGSKAKEQLLAIREGKSSPQIIETAKVEDVAKVFGTNPRPSQGRFSEDGAG